MKKIKSKKELIRYYMGVPYSIRIIPEEVGGYFAEVEELSGCMTQGDTIEEVMKNIEEAKESWLTVAIEEGIEIPRPREMEEYSGKFLVRMPKSLHRKLANLAEREGVSLNQMVVTLLSERYSIMEIKEEMQGFLWKMGEVHKGLYKLTMPNNISINKKRIAEREEYYYKEGVA